MEIIRFEPGDGTSYRVLFHTLTQEEATAVGGLDAGAVLFGFSSGAMRPLPCGVFQPVGFLALDYYAEQMGRQQEWTQVAGYIVLCYLTGRIGENSDHGKEVLGAWRRGWDLGLTPLLKRGGAGTGRGAGRSRDQGLIERHEEQREGEKP